MGVLDWLFSAPPDYDKELPADARAAAEEPPPADQQALKLHVGDIVGYEGTDYQIEQKYIYTSGGYKWYTYHLLDKATDKETWLNAEFDDELELGISEDIKLELPRQLPKSINYNGITYSQEEHGHAQVTIWNAGSKDPVQTKVEYWDFEGPGTTALGAERWDDKTQASLDRPIKTYELTIYPRRVEHER